MDHKNFLLYHQQITELYNSFQYSGNAVEKKKKMRKRANAESFPFKANAETKIFGPVEMR